MKIKDITSVEILDSRGYPTLKTVVVLENGTTGWAAIPSGASTGSYEALELRDKDPKRYFGKGVLTAKHNVDVIINNLLKDRDVSDQETLDRIMIEADGTANKSKLGANAILSVSLAAARAGAATGNVELYQYLKRFFPNAGLIMPVPMINVINGGKHAEGASDFQEYMLMPHGFQNFSESLRAAAETFQKLKKSLTAMNQPTTVGDEGGFAPRLGSNREPLRLLVEAIETAGYTPGEEIAIALDVAASEFYQDGKYTLKAENRTLTRDELTDYYLALKEDYPIYSIEDPYAEDDWQGFVGLKKKVGDKIQIVGDDLYVTNPQRFKKGIALEATNAILIKLNQIGSLTETIEVMRMAREAGQNTVVSHRSGETEDAFIADFAVASGAGMIKTGSVSRSERLVKYNRLMEIEAMAKNTAFYQFPYMNQ